MEPSRFLAAGGSQGIGAAASAFVSKVASVELLLTIKRLCGDRGWRPGPDPTGSLFL
jgi:hypothetical protein